MFLELSGISKAFGGRQVIRDLNLAVDQSEVVCLLGASGCGKTTTLRIVGGFLVPDAGRVVVDGVDVTDMPPEVRPTSTVFQSYALFPHLNVLGNVEYGLRFQHADKAEGHKRALEILDAVGLSDYADARITDISGGQQQRVALARSLVLNPKVLLLDEPFSNLDANLRLRMRTEVREIQERFGVTMLFVTHDREEAMAFGDRIAIMDEGRFLQVGTAQEVYQHPANMYCAQFLGHVNQLEHNGETLLFRPEDILLGKVGGFSATISEFTYLGSVWEYQLQCQGTELLARVKGDKAFTKGQTVPFAIEKTFTV